MIRGNELKFPQSLGTLTSQSAIISYLSSPFVAIIMENGRHSVSSNLPVTSLLQPCKRRTNIVFFCCRFCFWQLFVFGVFSQRWITTPSRHVACFVLSAKQTNSTFVQPEWEQSGIGCSGNVPLVLFSNYCRPRFDTHTHTNSRSLLVVSRGIRLYYWSTFASQLITSVTVIRGYRLKTKTLYH